MVLGNVIADGSLVLVGKILDIFPQSSQVKILVNSGVFFQKKEVLFFEPSFLQEVISIFRRRAHVNIASPSEVVCIPIDTFSLRKLKKGAPVFKFVPREKSRLE